MVGGSEGAFVSLSLGFSLPSTQMQAAGPSGFDIGSVHPAAGATVSLVLLAGTR